MTTGNPNKTPPTLEKKQANPHAITRHITFVTALMALACSLYILFTDVQNHQISLQQIKALHTQLNVLTKQQKNTQDELSSIKKNVQNKLTTLHQHIESALNQGLYPSKDWLLLKIRYYLELANINAHWTNNKEATIALLEQANTLLANIHDARFFDLRQNISTEITQLKTLPNIDMIGLLSQLDAAQTAVNQLPLKPILTANKPILSTHQSPTWLTQFKDNLNLLGQLVIVRRHDDKVLPIPSQAYESMLRERIQFNLQETQWAVLQHNEQIYQFSLTQAIKHIENAFDLNQPETKALIQQLTALQQTHLFKQKPLLGKTLLLINQLIDEKTIQQPNTVGDHL